MKLTFQKLKSLHSIFKKPLSSVVIMITLLFDILGTTTVFTVALPVSLL